MIGVLCCCGYSKCPRRPYAGIFFLFLALFRPCNGYLFLFSTYVVLVAAFLIFVCHILQNSCRLFCLLRLCSGLLRCVLVPGTLAFHLLYLDELRLFLFFSLTLL